MPLGPSTGSVVGVGLSFCPHEDFQNADWRQLVARIRQSRLQADESGICKPKVFAKCPHYLDCHFRGPCLDLAFLDPFRMLHGFRVVTREHAVDHHDEVSPFAVEDLGRHSHQHLRRLHGGVDQPLELGELTVVRHEIGVYRNLAEEGITSAGQCPMDVADQHGAVNERVHRNRGKYVDRLDACRCLVGNAIVVDVLFAAEPQKSRLGFF